MAGLPPHRFHRHAPLVFLILSTACAANRPKPIPIERSRDLSADFETTWKASVDAIAGMNVTISTIEKDSGVIVLAPFSYGATQALEGKLGFLEEVAARNGAGNVFVSRNEASAGKTTVRVNVRLSAQIRYGNGSQMFPFSYYPIETYSNGSIESIVLDTIEGRLAGTLGITQP